MKNLKLSFVALATLVLGTFVFTGCSNDESTVTPENSTLNFRITNENAFISDFYGTSWTTGRSKTAVDSAGIYNVTEIIVGSDTRARGYIVKDKRTHELLYFADVDRTGYVLRIVNLVTEERETIANIDRNPDYSLTDGFDIIKIVDDGDHSYVTYGYYTYGACGYNPTTGACFAGVYYQKTFLGFRWGEEKQVLKANGITQETTPCDCTTGTITPFNPNS